MLGNTYSQKHFPRRKRTLKSMHESKQSVLLMSLGQNKEAERLTACLCCSKRNGGNKEALIQNQTSASFSTELLDRSCVPAQAAKHTIGLSDGAAIRSTFNSLIIFSRHSSRAIRLQRIRALMQSSSLVVLLRALNKSSWSLCAIDYLISISSYRSPLKQNKATFWPGDRSVLFIVSNNVR